MGVDIKGGPTQPGNLELAQVFGGSEMPKSVYLYWGGEAGRQRRDGGNEILPGVPQRRPPDPELRIGRVSLCYFGLSESQCANATA